MGYKVAVVGATGNVGHELLNILAEREFPVDEVVALASHRSIGKEVSFGEKDVLKVQDLEGFDFKGFDIALFSPGGSVSAVHAPRAAKAGCVVIDNTSHFRMDPDVPLIVPEVNADAISGFNKKNIIANPNCSTIQMVVALKPLHDAAGIKRIVVSTYQAVSGAGNEAMDELFTQTKGIFVNQAPEPTKFSKQIAFNVIPQIGDFMEDGSTEEEWKMMVETKKILDPKIKTSVTCVRVPVFVGHSEAINVELERELDAAQAREILRTAPGVFLYDNPEEDGYITPVEAAGEYATYVSRVRDDASIDNGLNLWVVSDNLRKGAALNTVQIAEVLINRYLSKAA
ncbi:MAG: aspartate-semialdehyde dehydrogenase [Alphaproteobacteria bacterium]|jgi:aspartate-semialdehyde dehydrogenase|nr:aspartate-semialdehyde dehydrogenase [Alphaproteobacteria bacterium]MBT4017605.1 aspartate-semialdehyde dehydrogenase [Alphaproteobacteria bacterium]MBT4965520.1 aspartate-semialdehyde dehydrogenase [Alphaproteobacteria bacterium]MBT5159347.1 aspartate-semialdehyde dehydrogenase [Alphaproteobacteria bacterium]MBT6388146.1 aspartate-semialdehyde dehydrogenase [Alphaproteobacteria bacterium]